MAIYAVVLAAGTGRRFGGGKLLASYAGASVLEGALAAAVTAPLAGVVLVTGARSDAVAAVARRAFPAVRVIYAAEWAEGMAASLRAGIAAFPPNATGALVFLGDMPRVPVSILPLLVGALKDGSPAAVPTFDGQFGHPVAFAASLFPDLAAITGDKGARGMLERLGEALVRIPAPDDGVLFDVDTRDDLTR